MLQRKLLVVFLARQYYILLQQVKRALIQVQVLRLTVMVSTRPAVTV